MTKHEFITLLQKQLRQRDVGEIDDIVQEYEDHFAFKLKDGYAEEEIAARLGDPQAIAAQYDNAGTPAKQSAGLKIFAGAGLAFADLFSFLFLLVLYAFSLVLMALAAASLGIAISYGFGLNPYGLLPPMPYHCAVIAAVTLLGLAVLSLLGMFFWTLLVTQLLKAYLRYRKNFMAAATGTAKQLPYTVHMPLRPRLWRSLRRLTLIALCVFGFGFVATYTACAVSAGALGWWHAWNWFV